MQSIQKVNLTVYVAPTSKPKTLVNPMYRPQMRYEEIAPDVNCVHLSGRLDVVGLNEIELKFTVMTALQRKAVIVDLSEVELLTSVGLGMLILSANNLKAQGKMMILLKPNRYVEKVVRMACLDEILPIEYDLTDALRRIKPE